MTCEKSCNIIFFCSLRLKHLHWTFSLCLHVGRSVCDWGIGRTGQSGAHVIQWDTEEEIKMRECKFIQAGWERLCCYHCFDWIRGLFALIWLFFLPFALLLFKIWCPGSPRGPWIKNRNFVGALCLWKMGDHLDVYKRDVYHRVKAF